MVFANSRALGPEILIFRWCFFLFSSFSLRHTAREQIVEICFCVANGKTTRFWIFIGVLLEYGIAIERKRKILRRNCASLCVKKLYTAQWKSSAAKSWIIQIEKRECCWNFETHLGGGKQWNWIKKTSTTWLGFWFHQWFFLLLRLSLSLFASSLKIGHNFLLNFLSTFYTLVRRSSLQFSSLFFLSFLVIFAFSVISLLLTRRPTTHTFSYF